MIRSKILNSGLFDPEYYLQTNEDVLRSGLDPLTHYVRHGAFEGRSPSGQFNAAEYLRDNPDIHGKNPLLHYVEHGRKEGRRVTPAPYYHIAWPPHDARKKIGKRTDLYDVPNSQNVYRVAWWYSEHYGRYRKKKEAKRIRGRARCSGRIGIATNI